MRGTLKLLTALFLLFLFVTPALAEHIFGPDELDTTYGIYFRLRQETWDNVFDFYNDDHKDDNFFRLKTSLWTKLDYDKRYIFFIKLTNEARYFMNTSNTSSRPFGLNEDEIVFDNLNLEVKNLLGLPIDLKIGRQDFLFAFGEGFLIMDGTPWDGSRTFYFNAAKASVRLNEKNSLDLVYITNQDRDRYLPSIYPAEKRRINYSDEQGFVIYARSKQIEGFTIEPYYIFKNEETEFLPDGELDLNTIGARVLFSYGTWQFGGEFAHQWGEYDSGRDREGNGGYIFVKRAYKDMKWRPAFELRYVYLSGDDPDTDENEAWDPLFSRWPWLSDLFILTLAPETGIPAYWTNLQLYRAGVKLAFTKNTGFGFNYNYLRANDDPATNDGTPSKAPLYSFDSKERGHLLQAKLSHRFTKAIDGYLLVEHMIPGGFYKYDDSATFFRWQLQIKL